MKEHSQKKKKKKKKKKKIYMKEENAKIITNFLIRGL